MKILISSIWGLYGAGGINTYLQALVKGLSTVAERVDVLCPSEDGTGIIIKGTDYFVNKQVLLNQISPIVEMNASHLHPWIKTNELDTYVFEKALSFFPLQDYDIIHTQDVISTRAFSRVKPKQTALVSTIHGVFAKEWYMQTVEAGFQPNPDYWKYAVLREQIGVLPNGRTIVPSNWVKELMVNEFNISSDCFTVLPYGMDVEGFSAQIEQSTNIPKPMNKKVILVSARLDAVKGHKYLIEALVVLKEKRTDWECWLAGTGILENSLKNSCHELGLDDHVKFLGSRQDIPALLKAADLFVLPSVQDNQPFALIEAMLAGKPVIASNAGGIPEMINKWSTGLLFQNRISGELVYLLEEALKNESMCCRLGVNAKNWARDHWSLNKLVENTMKVYHSAIVNNSQESEDYSIPDKRVLNIFS